MEIALVAALDRARVIGRGDRLPWRLPDDQRFFRLLTTGHCVVMGRRTYESIGRPLPERLNIVVSRSAGFRPEGCVVVPSLAAAFQEARRQQQQRCFVVGGARLYGEALPHCERLYLTRVEACVEGDVHFPEALPEGSAEWRLVSETPHPADARHAYAFRIQEWQRIHACD